MADPGVEPNVFQLPNLVGAANQQQRQNKQDQFRTLGFLNKFQKQQGKYLPAHKPLVQEAYKGVEEMWDVTALNDSPKNRRKLMDAYKNYSNVAGDAQFIAGEWIKEQDYLSKNANKLPIPVSDASARLQGIANNPIDEMQMTILAEDWTNNGMLPRGYKTEIKNVPEQAKFITSLGSNKFNNEFLSTGKLDVPAATKWVDQWLESNIEPGQADDIALSVLLADGVRGTNGNAGPDDYVFVQNLDPEKKQEYVNTYKERVKDEILGNLSRKKRLPQGSGGGTPKVLTTETLTLTEEDFPLPDKPLVEEGDFSRTGTEVSLATTKPIRVGDGTYIFGFGSTQDGKPISYKTESKKLSLEEIVDIVGQPGDKNVAQLVDAMDAKGYKLQFSPTTRRDIIALQSGTEGQYKEVMREFIKGYDKIMTAEMYKSWLSNKKKTQ